MKCRTSAVKRLCVWLGCLLVVCPVLSRSFIHPGVLHTKERMKQIRALVKEKNEVCLYEIEDGTGFQCGLFECSDVGYYGE